MADFSTYTKEELLKLIEKQEKELKAKKYGLVWDGEREPEQVVLDCENNLPVLKRLKSKGIRTDESEDNILIEGDNYYALTVLNYTHIEKIDVIYIDPPYNTGEQDFSGGEKAYKFIDENGNVYRGVSMAWPNKTMNELLENNLIIFGKDEKKQPERKYFLKDNLFENTNSIYENADSDDMFFSELEISFPYPKPVSTSEIFTFCHTP